ncbi:MAG: VCBS repeat-containing protein [Thermoanaerobaculia bacterium]|nr:VCBS repeat-containing protein [Thermoanaerobaculia bacterium]
MKLCVLGGLIVLGTGAAQAGWSPVLTSNFPAQAGSGSMLGSVAVGNVDDDPALEIVVNSRMGIEVFDLDGTSVSSYSTHSGVVERPVNMAPTLYDLDNDGRLEIIFATARESFGDFSNLNSIIALNGENGTVLWSRTLDSGLYNTPDSGYQTIENRFYWTGAQRTQLPPETTFAPNASPLPIYDLDGDGALEVVVNVKIRPEPFQDHNPFIQPI